MASDLDGGFLPARIKLACGILIPAAFFSSVGVAGFMSASLHSANPRSTPLGDFAENHVCARSNAFRAAIAQTANMADRPNKLAKWRKKAGLTQDQLGAAIGTTKSVISLFESGDRPLTDEWLEKIAPVVGAPRRGDILDSDPDGDEAEVIHIWRHIQNNGDKAQALRVLRTFLGESRNDG